MIKSNELRIGNKVAASGLHKGDTMTVKEIHKDNPGIKYLIFFEEDGVGEYIDDCDPIPLTPEILQACGFEYEDMGDDSPYERWVCKEYKELWVWNYNKSKEWLFCLGNGFEQGGFKYLHQLQNLYFALTGEELNYKL